MNRNYKEFIKRKKEEYGSKFNTSDINEKFIPYYESQQRITIGFGHGEVKRGTVGVTTGWKPAFILILTKRSKSSSYIIDNDCQILAI